MHYNDHCRVQIIQTYHGREGGHIGFKEQPAMSSRKIILNENRLSGLTFHIVVAKNIHKHKISIAEWFGSMENIRACAI